MIIKAFLVVDAAGNVRAARRPRVGPTEVAFVVHIKVPDGWGRVIDPAIELTMPDVPSVEVVQ